ncbi:MAG: LysR substrate-binding domain-containing protein [Gammaproteobacteria bacterium]
MQLADLNGEGNVQRGIDVLGLRVGVVLEHLDHLSRVVGHHHARLAQALQALMSLTFYVGEMIREGRLRVVLTDYQTLKTSVYAIYPERRYISPKVRACIDFFAQRFGPDPYWDRF